MEIHPSIGAVAILLITIVDFFISLTKASFKNITDSALERKREENASLVAKAEEFLEKRERSFYNATWILIGMSFIADGMFLLASVNAYYMAHEVTVLRMVLCIISVCVLIYLIILFSHIIPDRLGSKLSEKFFFATFGLMRMIEAVLRPISVALEGGCRLALRMCGVNSDAEDNVTEEEIISIVNEGQEQGILEAEEAEMISNIMDFDEKQTKDIMTHRTKIIAVDSEMGIEEAMNFMAEQSFSRFPLYTDDIDNIVGVIHLKDVVKCFSTSNHKNKRLIDIARKPMFVPDTQNIDDLFKDMQSKNVHMAIAIDEYGQTAGIVAMEDILEEIVGNIQDEFDKEEELIRTVGEDTYICSGEANLNELCEITNLELKEEDSEAFDTLNGLLISILDRIPGDNERETVTYQNYSFEILETHHKMIKKVCVTKLPEITIENESGN